MLEVKPGLNASEAYVRLALIKGQKETGSREMIRIDEGGTVRRESTQRGKARSARKGQKEDNKKKE